jgi:PAS domain S-box-containing protein
MNIRYRRLARYGLALGSAGAGLLLRLALTRLVGPGLPTFVTFYPAVILVALTAGFGPGLVATLAAALIADYWIIPPLGLLRFPSLMEGVGLAFFTGIGVVFSVAAELYRRMQSHLEELVAVRTAEMERANEQLKQEIAERQGAGEALRESEERLKRSQEIAHLGSWELDLVHNGLTWSDEVYRIFGLQPQEFGATYEAFLQRVHPDDRAAVDAAYSGSLRENRDTYEVEHRVVRNDTGDIRVVHEKCEHFRDATGKIIRSVGMVHDVTERKRMEEVLRKSRDELEIRVQERTAELAKAYKELKEQSRILQAFFTSTITPLVFLDKNFNYVRVNEAYGKACQRDISEFLGHNHFEFYPSAAKALFERVVETKTPYQAIARPFTFPDHPEWGVTYWNWTLTPILDDAGETEFLVFSLQDVTERKRAEEAVKVEKQRFNDVLEILPAYLVLLSPDYHVPFANRFFRERFGESHGQRCFEYLFGRSEPCETCESYTALKTMAPHGWEWTGPDGRIYDVFDFPFTDTDGSTLILEMGIDITERERAQEALKAASLYTRSLIEASLDPLVTISADGKIMDVNKATELVTGISREGLVGTDFSNYFTDPKKAREGYEEVFSKGFVRDYPLAIRHTSGKVTDVLYHAAVYRNEAGELQGVFAAARDITEWKRMEEELRKSENRLRLLSSQLLTVQEAERKRIAREIHDSLGQTLAAIKFGLENKLSQMGAGAPPPGVSIENIISLTQNGIEESRRIQMDLRPSVLDDLGILATIGWFTREFEKVYVHISVEKQISVEENEIPDSLRTVLFRVMQEAMNNVAKHSKADLVRLILKKTAEKIQLSIKDNGDGFDPENIKHGLGLTSMRERTELSGGAFAVESIPGKGTTIRASWVTLNI